MISLLIVEPRAVAYDGAFFAELLLIDGSSLIHRTPFERRERAQLVADTAALHDTTATLSPEAWALCEV